MISRSDWEPLPTPTLSPFARGYLSLCRFFFHCRRVVCACSAGAVGSFYPRAKGLRVGLGSGSQSLRLIFFSFIYNSR